MSQNKKINLLLAALLSLILVLAFFVRAYHIESIPAGLFPDEAANGIDALDAIKTHDFKLFYPANSGREGLFINIQALFIAWLGNNIFAIKLASILFGTLSVLGIYLLGKELFHRRGAGILAAFMLATSYWGINFSRIGFRAIMVTFLLTFSFYFFFKGLRTQRLRDLLISGLIFGLGLHTYIAFRLAPLILIILLPALMLSYENFLKRFWKHILVFIFGALVTAAPMLYHFFISHPEDFASRTSHISVFSSEANGGNLPRTLLKTFSLSLIKYNFWGDQNWRDNYPPYPLLDPIVGTLFLSGFLYTLWQTIILLGRRIRENDRDTRLVTDFFLLGSFFVMLMPEFLTNEGLPHALRSIGTQMPVFLLASFSAFWIIKKALRSQTGTKIALFSLLFISLTTSAIINITKYFVFFAQNELAAASFNENYTNMGRYLLSLPPETQKYVLAPTYSEPVDFLTRGRVAHLEFVKGDTVIRQPSIFLMVNYDEALTKRIQKFYPNAYVERIDMNGPTRGGGEFNVIILPSEQNN